MPTRGLGTEVRHKLDFHLKHRRSIALNRHPSRSQTPSASNFKAGKGIRTLDIQLGKLTLYQLSYARELCSVYQWDSCFWLHTAAAVGRAEFMAPKPARMPVLLRSYS